MECFVLVAFRSYFSMVPRGTGEERETAIIGKVVFLESLS